MHDVTRLLSAVRQGTLQASDDLFPLVYDELRRLANQKLTLETPGQTLQATALVHEAYLRLVGIDNPQCWENRGHFFAAAAEAMRRILIEAARRKAALKRGGDGVRLDLDQLSLAANEPEIDLLSLDEALTELEQHHPQAAELVKLRFFAGLTHTDAAEALGIERRAADRLWLLAKTWLFRHLSQV
jgi:RNA polymerase sigma factor (TIGR02999 family)